MSTPSFRERRHEESGSASSLLALAWLALTGSFTHPERVARPCARRLRLVLRARAAPAQRDRDTPAAHRRGWPCCSSTNWCFPAIAWSQLVLTPRMDLKPGIFAYRLEARPQFRDHAAGQPDHADAGHAVGRRLGGPQDAVRSRDRLLGSRAEPARHRRRFRARIMEAFR